jgi:hypothetical protein
VAKVHLAVYTASHGAGKSPPHSNDQPFGALQPAHEGSPLSPQLIL